MKSHPDLFTEGAGLAVKDKVSKKFWDDITHFEGNANAFRILTHCFKGRRQGGFVMTYSMLASIVKYPFASSLAGSHGKFGFSLPRRNRISELRKNWALPVFPNQANHSSMPVIP